MARKLTEVNDLSNEQYSIKKKILNLKRQC